MCNVIHAITVLMGRDEQVRNIIHALTNKCATSSMRCRTGVPRHPCADEQVCHVIHALRVLTGRDEQVCNVIHAIIVLTGCDE